MFCIKIRYPPLGLVGRGVNNHKQLTLWGGDRPWRAHGLDIIVCVFLYCVFHDIIYIYIYIFIYIYITRVQQCILGAYLHISSYKYSNSTKI